MSPALVQALQGLIVIAVVGALTAVGINHDRASTGRFRTRRSCIPVITCRHRGGPEVPRRRDDPASPTLPADAYFAKKAASFDWPHFWSV